MSCDHIFICERCGDLVTDLENKIKELEKKLTKFEGQIAVSLNDLITMHTMARFAFLPNCGIEHDRIGELIKAAEEEK